MKYRLLVELEVIYQLQAMPKRRRAELMAVFQRLREAPDYHSRFPENEPNGRRIEVCVERGFAIRYWLDFADRDVKVLSITPEEP